MKDAPQERGEHVGAPRTRADHPSLRYLPYRTQGSDTVDANRRLSWGGERGWSHSKPQSTQGMKQKGDAPPKAGTKAEAETGSAQAMH